ncbi:MAG: DUF5694 domain-containing protein [Pseudomonadota bacterium]
MRGLVKRVAGAAALTAALAAAMTVAGIAGAAAQDDRPGFSGVQQDLAGPPTRILVLGTPHLNQLPEDAFEPAHLELVMDRLAAFAPDVIAIEAVGGRACDTIRRYAEFYDGVADQYCTDPGPAQKALGMDAPAALREALSTVETLGDAVDDKTRRRLAALFYAAGEPWTAALHWSLLAPKARLAADGVSDDVRARLDKNIVSRNENNLIGIALARRLGLTTLAAMDDHTADFVYAFAPETLWPTVQSVWSSPTPGADAIMAEQQSYLGSAEKALAGYRFVNSPRYQRFIIDADFGKAAATPDNDYVARQYLAWWQTRGLRMAANVIEAAGNEPGANVLVIVGASHKAYFDAYLDQMQDVEIVSVDAVMADTP